MKNALQESLKEAEDKANQTDLNNLYRKIPTAMVETIQEGRYKYTGFEVPNRLGEALMPPPTRWLRRTPVKPLREEFLTQLERRFNIPRKDVRVEKDFSCYRIYIKTR